MQRRHLSTSLLSTIAAVAVAAVSVSQRIIKIVTMARVTYRLRCANCLLLDWPGVCKCLCREGMAWTDIKRWQLLCG
jgi:hypothetical protein